VKLPVNRLMNERESPMVLIGEDELLIATTLEMMLSDKGYRIAGPASTVEEALAVLETEQPDVALLDYRLGNSTTESLLSVLQQRGISVCMVTGYGRDALPERYQGYPVLEKPFSLGELLEELKRLCG
jgi:DNA-binding NtrC family response regulator